MCNFFLRNICIIIFLYYIKYLLYVSWINKPYKME
nr:MAG TPA: hypothetical protein [Caudoviricetes sp.]